MTDDGPTVKKTKTGHGTENAFVCDALDVFTFHLLLSSSKFELLKEIEAGGTTFNGEFFVQHFGQKEEITGFQNLSVDIWFSAHTYHTWCEIKWLKRKPGADKVVEILKKHFPHACPSKLDLVDAIHDALMSNASTLLSSGEPLACIDTAAGRASLVKYQLAAARSSVVKGIHMRMEPFLLFFIDGASLINNEDSEWELIFALLERPPQQNQSQESSSEHSRVGSHLVVGMQTMYNFWTLPKAVQQGSALRHAPTSCDYLKAPDNQRLRLSQVLVLPPYQGLGLGKIMIQLAYDMAIQKQCTDLTFEDPSPQLQRVREKLEVEMMCSHPWVVEKVQECLEASKRCLDNLAVAARALLPSATLLSRINQELKIHRRQVQAVWEAVLFIQCGGQCTQAALCQLIKNRLNVETFGSICAGDAKKKVHPVQDVTGGNRSFIMMATKESTLPLCGTSMDEESSESNATASGRLNVVMVSNEEKELRLQELVEERMGQLHTLSRLLRKKVSEPSLNTVHLLSNGKLEC
ncbi:hypothetical protein CEUSTIGMA_g6671.t1 [Chlamydomonas eustigma]|uniref:histone acetyltransferase n=1 Tax=Chlamydomonas eustigma TaxID=1157962 RepID=A0A250X821_9CHLO|nr:hypothetical protein CEUSTIGMA_g6671.t1 [Chlamydomonas eustigma]|eukprot:GAX79231.1 hypothetical protein CEUSTIGMA_g6671.t1 [Chlamydomonas eustigma]